MDARGGVLLQDLILPDSSLSDQVQISCQSELASDGQTGSRGQQRPPR